MNFALPEQQYTEQRQDVAQFLRALEQSCPRTTPLEVKAALITAAVEIERWRTLSQDTARRLEEAATVRISQMATTSQADEIQRGVKQTMLDLAARFRDLA